ncbi:MAG TPA: HEAT repeat domain-containing protein, partial [Planctomycetaceae bacterium]|nr:HEAT repeat domain-containing protein [Planctomycetaceae bacterium]
MALRVSRLGFGSACLFALAFLSPAALNADAQNDEFVQMIVKLIGDRDKEFRAAGLEQVRTAARGPALTQLFAAQLTKLDLDGQIALLSALADRGDHAARAAVLDLLGSSHDENVRAGAIRVLGRLGESQDLPLLIKSLSAGSQVEQAA